MKKLIVLGLMLTLSGCISDRIAQCGSTCQRSLRKMKTYSEGPVAGDGRYTYECKCEEGEGGLK